MSDAQPPELYLVVDVGNTTSVFGLFLGAELVRSFRISSEAQRTADEYAALLLPLFERCGHRLADVRSILFSSVVPSVNQHLARLAAAYFEAPARFVDAGLDTGIEIHYDSPHEVGADRIVNSVAARETYGAPVISVDFGTTTNFDVVDEEGAFVGGVIAPGIGISAEALFSRAARLFKVDIRKPERVLGSNTEQAVQAGLYYGSVGLVDGILERLLADRADGCAVVATGGQAELIASGSRFIQNVDPDLTLTGLRLICQRNSR